MFKLMVEWVDNKGVFGYQEYDNITWDYVMDHIEFHREYDNVVNITIKKVG